VDAETAAIREFEQRCLEAWGAPIRTSIDQFGDLPRIQDWVDLGPTPDSLKVHIAEKLILESVPTIGLYVGAGDVEWYLHNFAREFRGDHEFLNGRRVTPLKSALLLTANAPIIGFWAAESDDESLVLAGGSAVAALYLLSQLEYTFRMASRYLDGEGIVVRPTPPELRKQVPHANAGQRVNQIKDAFIIYLYRTPTQVARKLRSIERKISISSRLEVVRNPAMHGFLGDTATEGRFYGLLLGMFYYAERTGK